MPLIVVSGGTHAGKSTLIDALARANWTTVPEAGIQVIEELTERLGLDGQAEWRRRHRAEFQTMLALRQAELERQVRHGGSGAVFFDRGVHDSIAYSKFYGIPAPTTVLELAHSHAYDHAFILETIPEFDARADTGRQSTYEDSCAVHRLLVETYRESGIPTTVVPVMPRAERLAMVTRGLTPP